MNFCDRLTHDLDIFTGSRTVFCDDCLDDFFTGSRTALCRLLYWFSDIIPVMTVLTIFTGSKKVFCDDYLDDFLLVFTGFQTVFSDDCLHNFYRFPDSIL